MHSGKLWTPEGHGFEPVDGAWWSLLVRQARGFRAIYAELCALERLVRVGSGAEGRRDEPAEGGSSRRREASRSTGLPVERPAGPPTNSFHRHFPTESAQNQGFSLEKPLDEGAQNFIRNLLATAHKVGFGGGVVS